MINVILMAYCLGMSYGAFYDSLDRLFALTLRRLEVACFLKFINYG